MDMRMRFLFSIMMVCFSVALMSAEILPGSFRLPSAPVPGTSGCASCSRGNSEGNEIPVMDHQAIAMLTINLMEEKDSFDYASRLLTVRPGANAVFSPESRFLLQPPGDKAKGGNDYLRVVLANPIRFRAKVDEVGHSEFYSYTLPGYSLRRENSFLVVTDFNSQIEYRFASFDGGQNWKIDSIQKVNAPFTAVKCKYNSDNLVTEIHLPGNRRYLLEYQYGLPCRVTSPAGAVTTVEWDEAGMIRRLKTELTPKHPLYAQNRPKGKRRNRRTPLIVRELHFSCSPLGALREVVNSSGERYTVRTLSGKDAKGVEERTAIVTYPDGVRKYRTNQIIPGGKKVLIDGVVLVKNGKDKFVPLKKEEFVRKNGTYITKGRAGVTNEYKAGTLAVTATVDAYGNRTSFTYNPCGQQTSVTYPDKARKVTEYDKKGNRIKETDECGRIKTWTYDSDGLLTRFQYGDLVTQYEYDEQKRPVKTTVPGNLVHRFAWDKESRIISYTRPDGVVTEYRYYGGLDKIRELSVVANDKSQKYARNYLYDIQGRLKRINYPDRTWEGFAYDCCNMTAQRARSGEVRRHAYNQQKQKIRDISASGEVTAYEYDPVGNLVRIIYPNKTFTAYVYSADGHLLKTEGSNRLAETYERDKMDRVAATRRADGAEAKTHYDARGRFHEVTGDLERNISFEYDRSGNIVKSIDWGLPRQKTPRTSSFTYDKMNRKIKSVQNGREEYVIYRPATSFVDRTLSDGILRCRQYDSFGREISSSAIPEKEYELANNAEERRKVIEKRRNEFRFYDIFGNLAQIRDGKGNLHTQYTFRPDGQIESILRPTSDSSAELQTYKQYYSQDGEQIFEIYKKDLAWEEKK